MSWEADVLKLILIVVIGGLSLYFGMKEAKKKSKMTESEKKAYDEKVSKDTNKALIVFGIIIAIIIIGGFIAILYFPAS